MKPFQRFFSLMALGLAVSIGSTGCELSECDDGEEEDSDGVCLQAKSLTKFRGSETTESAVWQAGGSLTIDGRNGAIDVVQGNGDQVVVVFQPFVFRAFDTPEEEVKQDLQSVETSLTEDGTALTARASQGSKSTSGAEITVQLPANFDGSLKIIQGNGSTDVNYVGGATALDVFSDNGSCDIQGNSSVVSTKVNCENGKTEVFNVADLVNITAGNGNLEVSISSVSDGFETESTITAGNGDITLSVPGSGRLSVQATARETVDFGSVPSGCSENAAADNSKTLTCNGGGANYKLDAAGPLSDVLVQYL